MIPEMELEGAENHMNGPTIAATADSLASGGARFVNPHGRTSEDSAENRRTQKAFNWSDQTARQLQLKGVYAQNRKLSPLEKSVNFIDKNQRVAANYKEMSYNKWS